MAKKRKSTNHAKSNQAAYQGETEQGSTLKDLISGEVLQKLKAQADELKQAEVSRKEEIKRQEEEAKKKEQKLRENDFAYLLENSALSSGKYK